MNVRILITRVIENIFQSRCNCDNAVVILEGDRASDRCQRVVNCVRVYKDAKHCSKCDCSFFFMAKIKGISNYN